MRVTRLFLALWALGALSAALGHLFYPAIIADWSSWGRAPGWQREIAFFDLGFASSIVVAMMRRREDLQCILAIGLSGLSIALGIHHFGAYLSSGENLHMLYAGLNCAGVVLALFGKPWRHTRSDEGARPELL